MRAWLPAWLPGQPKCPLPGGQRTAELGALGGTRTPNLLIRRSSHIVQDRPSWSVRWADIPESSAHVQRCPATWQQYWQQSRRTAMISDRLFSRPDRAQVCGARVTGCLRRRQSAGGCCRCRHSCRRRQWLTRLELYAIVVNGGGQNPSQQFTAIQADGSGRIGADVRARLHRWRPRVPRVG
jgi:hypothetical protein